MPFSRFQPRSIKPAIASAGGFCLLLTLGCAGPAGTSGARPTDAELCASLQEIVGQADTRFQRYKTTQTIDPLSGMAKWETRPVFPDSQCDVLEWGGGRTNYVCTWNQGSEAQARDIYLKNSRLIASCLVPPWTRAETRGQTGGALVFTKAGTSTQVVMRYFMPRRAFGSVWETSLTIGDEVTAEMR